MSPKPEPENSDVDKLKSLAVANLESRASVKHERLAFQNKFDEVAESVEVSPHHARGSCGVCKSVCLARRQFPCPFSA